MLFMARLGGTRLADADGLAVDGLDDTLPASQCFLQAEFNGCDEVISRALEGWVVKLSSISMGRSNS
jgi:hypothetical protein